MRNLLVTFLLVSAACSSSGDGGEEMMPDAAVQGGNHRTLTAVVNGNSFTASLEAGATPQSGTLGITGANLDGQAIAIALLTTTTGTFPVGAGSITSIIYADHTQSWRAGGTVGSGTVTITSFTANEVQGTFEAVLVPVSPTTGANATLTNGVFDLSY